MSELPPKSPDFGETPKSEFTAKLEARWAKGNFVCIGLDSDYSLIPDFLKTIAAQDNFRGEDIVERVIEDFNRQIVESTSDLACAYKPNVAFYEAYGEAGLRGLKRTIDYIKYYYPEIPIILDAKRADIGNTNSGYVKSAFDVLGADAITVNPYFGGGSLNPFTEREDKGIVILARTSNPEAPELQDLPVDLTKLPKGDDKNKSYEEKFGDLDELRRIMGSDIVPMYTIVAFQASRRWNANGNIALVVGATYPGELKKVREIVGDDMAMLIPGIKTQGGEVEATVKAGKDSRNQGMIINSSRGIIFASKGEDFAEAARAATGKLDAEINQYRV